MEGENVTLIVLALVVVAAILLVWLMMARRKSAALRDRFGEEYDRTVETRGGRAAGEADLESREARVKELDIRPLGPEERERFTAEWKDVKATFVDAPGEAISHADRLLTTVMKTRGYPMADFEHRHADLTVSHGNVAKHYLAGHEIAERHGAGEASTEDLRQGLIHYEALFDDLVNDQGDPDRPRPVSRQAQVN